WANETYPMYTDIFHLYPVQGLANSHRSNLPFGEVDPAKISYTTENGSLKGDARSGLGYTGTVFEPIDEYKGDFARTYFYMTTRYYTQDGDWGTSGMTDGCELKLWAIEMLLDWHDLDPVSLKELDRNEAVYAIQGNRNPFIDHPEFADLIWSAPSSGFEPPEARSADNIEAYAFTANWLGVSEASGYKLYISENSGFSGHISGYGPKDVGNATSEIVTGLSPSTSYYYRLKAYKPGEETAYSGIITVQTEPPSGWVDSTKIFFSEYIEGTNYNKALEIYNGTGEDVNLGNLTIKLYINGSETPGSTLDLSGALNNGDVYVIGYTAGANTAVQEILAVSDITTGGVTNFNGNDAVALFYNNVMIDVIGNIGLDSYFAENVTLVRRPDVFRGSTTFDLGDWDAYPVNTFDYLGWHEVEHDTPLAISLRDFKATYINGDVLLEWSTASETENAAFQIYRNDVFLTTVSGAGTTCVPHLYEYTDNAVQAGRQYGYLLVDLAYDGTVTAHYDRIQTLRIPGPGTNITIGNVYPNPGNPDMVLPVQLDAAAQITLTLFDVAGKKRQRTLTRSIDAAGHYEIPLDLNDLRSGLYLLRIESGSFSGTRKILLLK
ncbi:MAG: endonuclease, partial [FCB group bacterium]|nr:endonuclease [FCB group bacterium]